MNESTSTKDILPSKVIKDDLDNLVAQSKVEFAVFDSKLTVAVVTLPCGFKVTGEASCVDPSNFDKALGEKYALENAVKKLWELEGYLLANYRYLATKRQDGLSCDCCEWAQADEPYPVKEGDEFDFGSAICLLKEGLKVARKGWNGKDMFLYHVPASAYPAQRNNKATLAGMFPDDMVPYGAYIAMKTAQGNVVPWLASQTDMLAEDWLIVT